MDPKVNGAVRTMLAALGGVFVTMGWVDAMQLDTLINALMEIGGASITLGALVWSIWAKIAASREAAKVAAAVLKVKTPPEIKAIAKGATP